MVLGPELAAGLGGCRQAGSKMVGEKILSWSMVVTGRWLKSFLMLGMKELNRAG